MKRKVVKGDARAYAADALALVSEGHKVMLGWVRSEFVIR